MSNVVGDGGGEGILDMKNGKIEIENVKKWNGQREGKKLDGFFTAFFSNVFLFKFSQYF